MSGTKKYTTGLGINKVVFPIPGVLIPLLLFLCLASPLPSSVSADEGVRPIEDFQKGISPKWERKVFKEGSRHSIESLEGNKFLRIESDNSAMGLVYRTSFSPHDYPYLRWRWKIEDTLKKGDARTKEGDDYAARIYVVFPHWIPLLTRSINYIWANRLPKGASLPNAYYGKAVMVAVESGKEKKGRWIREERNILEDYRKIFGEEPGDVGAIAIMTDSDNTGESATAFYDDIEIGKKSRQEENALFNSP